MEQSSRAVVGPLERQVRPLPQSFVKRGLQLAEGALLFGKSFSDMTRDELIAAAAQGWNAERQQREKQYAESKERADWYVQRARERYGMQI
jgi:hypothetical protein